MGVLRFIAIVLMLGSWLAVAVGCGSTDSTSTSAAAATSLSTSASVTNDSTVQPLTTDAHGTPETASIKIGLPVTGPSFLPMYSADLRGFFKEQGLNAEVITFNGGSELGQALVGGSVNISVGALAVVLSSIEAGAKLKVFAGGFNQPEFRWYGKNVASFAEAKGKTFSVTKYGSSVDFALRYMLTVNGLDPEKDVKILQTGGAAAALAALDSGQVDVAVLAPPQWYEAEDAGYTLVGDLADVAPEYPDHVWAASESFIRENPETIKAALRAFAKAVEFDKSDKSGAVEDLMATLKYTDVIAGKSYDDSVGYWYGDGQMPAEKGMDIFWDMGITNGQFTEKWADAKWLDSSFLESYSEWK